MVVVVVVVSAIQEAPKSLSQCRHHPLSASFIDITANHQSNTR